MNREMRRQQEKLKNPARAAAGGGGAKSPAGLAGIGGGARGSGRGSGAAAGGVRGSFFKDIFSELRKVQWPTRQEAWNLTVVVILVSVVVGLALGGLDSAFGWIMQHTVLP